MTDALKARVLVIGAIAAAVLTAAAPAEACRRPANWTPPSEAEREANYQELILSQASTIQIAVVVEIDSEVYWPPRITYRAVEVVRGNAIEHAGTGELVISSRCDGMPNQGWYGPQRQVGDVVVLVLGDHFGEFGIIHAELIETPRAVALISLARGDL